MKDANDKLKTKILSDIRRGMDTSKIAKKHKVSIQKVSAYKAHITMGSY